MLYESLVKYKPLNPELHRAVLKAHFSRKKRRLLSEDVISPFQLSQGSFKAKIDASSLIRSLKKRERPKLPTIKGYDTSHQSVFHAGPHTISLHGRAFFEVSKGQASV